MKYLFFDIECSNCFDGTGKICEFGYVLTDEDLCAIDHGIFLVNPDSDFEQYVRWKIIKYKVDDYLNAPKYPEVYNSHISHLLKLEDTVLVGHGVKNDVKFLYDEAKRYSLPLPNITVVDAAVIWQRYHNDKNARNLKKLVNELGIGNPKTMHNSEYDAQMTVEYTKVLCEKSGMTFRNLMDRHFPVEDRKAILKYPSEIGANNSNKKALKNVKLQNKKGHSALRRLIKNIGAVGTRSDALKGKKITLSDNYTSDHFNEFLNLIGLIKAAGGEYELYAERCDVFCNYDKLDENGNKIPDKKLDFVKSAVLNGKHIEQISLNSLLDLLGITYHLLEEMPELDVEELLMSETSK